MNPKYPVYIPSKGRAESRLTAKALEKINVPYYIVIEPQEFKQYAAVIDESKILVLPFSNLGQLSIPARNWIREHSIKEGYDRHWQLDDNISGFLRLNRNMKIEVSSGTIFRIVEDFVDRYTNVAFAGFNYDFFAKARQKIPPFYLNTRIYSCTLANNRANYQWRGMYNEDTDICLRALKDGWCTVLFNAFLCKKAKTMTLSGGNTPMYQDDGRLKMAQSLVDQHPDVTRIAWKFGRYQHHVNYSLFQAKNKLIYKDNIVIEKDVDEFGMKLIQVNQ